MAGEVSEPVVCLAALDGGCALAGKGFRSLRAGGALCFALSRESATTPRAYTNTLPHQIALIGHLQAYSHLIASPHLSRFRAIGLSPSLQ
jgi:hypothetical protein